MEDTILEQELVRNERIITHSRFGALRLRRPTPAMDASIAEQRRKVYHRDLKDDTILTKEEVAQILLKRGIWTPDHDEKMQSFTVKSGELMLKLTALGYDPTSNLYAEIMLAKADLEKAIRDENVEVTEDLERIFSDPEIPSFQDIRVLGDTVERPLEVQKLSNLTFQMNILTEFAEIKAQLQNLLVTYTKFFGDTIEERANRAERMAQIFFCVTSQEDDTRLWTSFENMWDENPEDIAWLHSQLFNFQNGITEEYATVLQTYGFMERVTDTGRSSEDSQDHPQSKSDGESQEEVSENSSDQETPTS